MARRKVLRSWLAASLLLVSGIAGIAVSPSPAGAADYNHVVTVYEDRFEPSTVWAKPGESIGFVLAPGVGTHHTVTLEPAACNNRPSRLCEQRFDDPRDPEVDFRFSEYNDYAFYDRYAREAQPPREMTGRFVISASDPTVPPSTSTTSSSTTTTTAGPVTTPTTTGPTTTTTAPTSIRPLVAAPQPAPTTSTTAAAKAGTSPTPAPPAAGGDKGKDDKGKDDKGKAKAASTGAPETGTPAADAVPSDAVFDPAALTPGPTAMPGPDGSDTTDDTGLDASAAASLLDRQQSDDDTGKLLLMAIGALAAVLACCGGGWAYFTRASQYDPA